MYDETEQAGRSGRRVGPLRRVLDVFSNVWLGVVWATLFFLYCSIGSAMPWVRRHPALEMTEFEWFHWWPFNVLIMLFCTTLVLTTVRRIPLRLVNAGVWMIHTGIITLCVGSYYYFGTKIEGDTPVFRRQVRIEMPGMDGPVTLPVLPGNRVDVPIGPDLWGFQVQSTNTSWPILSEGHEGETAYAVNVLVRPPSGEAFVRQLLAGYPQFTEDIIPGQGRAIKSIGRKLVEEDLTLTLAYEPQEYFHVMQSWALFVRRAGDTEWSQRPIEGLPRYNDRIGSRDQVFSDPHDPVPLRTIDLTVPAAEGGDILSSATVRVTGYLAYARMERRWRDGSGRGARLNPVLRVTTLADQAAPQTHELVAFDRARNHSESDMIELRWVDAFSAVDALPLDSRAMLKISVPGANVSFDVPITPDVMVGHEGPFTPIEGTAFSYRILNLQDDLVIPGSGNLVSVAMVDIKTPEGRFTRMVADPPEKTVDMHGGVADPHAPTARKPEAADARIIMTYTPRSAPIIFAAYPKGVYLVVNGPSGRLLGRDVALGEVVEVVPGLSIRADALWTHAVAEEKPAIVPPERRQRNVGETFAMIRLEVDDGHNIQSRWLQFNQYAFPNDQYRYAGRFAYLPERFRLSDGTVFEVLFSRQRRRLPNPIALEEFELDTHVGGYTGQALTIRNYVSRLRFLEDGEWTDAARIKVNAPTEFGGYWYFQSTWDPPPSGNPSGGMNYTGLGVGNRNGVYVQLTGCCLAATGMLFAFYVKPVLKRRRAARSRGRVSDLAGADTDDVSAEACEEAALEVQA